MEMSITTPGEISPSEVRKKFVLIVLTYILIQATYPFIEKATLWGELFVLLTLFSITSLRYNAHGSQKHILFGVCLWMTALPVYGTIISLTYWNEEFKLIFLLRHLSFFYYAVFFFFAYKYANLIIYYFKKTVKPLVLFVTLASLVLKAGFKANNISFVPLFGFLLAAINQSTRKAVYFYLGFVGILGILLQWSGGGTIKMTVALYLGFLFFNVFAHYWTRLFPKKWNRVLSFLLLGSLFYAFVKYIDTFYHLTTHLALLGQSITTLSDMSQEAHTDLGGFWRLVLWSHLYGRFLENPMGLGIGTPLFAPWLDGFVMLHLYKPAENYVQGAHNSLITFIARMGIPCLVLWSYFLYHIAKITSGAFRNFNFQPFKTRGARLASSIFLAFGGIFISAQFNVVLESPLYAGIFWFSFGLFTKIVGDFSQAISLDDKEQCT